MLHDGKYDDDFEVGKGGEGLVELDARLRVHGTKLSETNFQIFANQWTYLM